MSDLKKLEKRISSIEDRNRRVELDKSWETSLTRKFVIAFLTYIVVVLFFIAASLPRPFVNALIPSLAFFLSTLTLPAIKNWWVKRRMNK